jgi:hypothetical protein
MNWVMLELEAGQPARALEPCAELVRVSAQMGEGSEAPHAAALDALIHYLLQDPQAAESLAQACQVLQRIDSPRLLAFVQTIAARWDLQQGDLVQAVTRAEVALEAAQQVNNPSEMALAWAVIITASRQRGNRGCADRHLSELNARVQDRALSAIAQTQLKHLDQAIPAPLHR